MTQSVSKRRFLLQLGQDLKHLAPEQRLQATLNPQLSNGGHKLKKSTTRTADRLTQYLSKLKHVTKVNEGTLRPIV